MNIITRLSQEGKRKSNGRQCFDLFPKKAKVEASALLSLRDRRQTSGYH